MRLIYQSLLAIADMRSRWRTLVLRVGKYRFGIGWGLNCERRDYAGLTIGRLQVRWRWWT